MDKVIVTESELRRAIAEALDSSSYVPEPKMVKVNDVVDQSAADTDPMNPDYKPQDAVELNVAFKRMTTGMDPDKAPKIFDVLKGALDGKDPDPDQRNEKDKEKVAEPSTTKSTTSTTGTKSGTRSGSGHQSEAVIRDHVRLMLSQSPPVTPTIESFDSYDQVVNGSEDEEELPDGHIVKAQATEDEIFAKIAKELGYSIAGAKQFVDKAQARFRFMSRELPNGPNLAKNPTEKREEADSMILQAFTDYVNHLETVPENPDAPYAPDEPKALTPDDVRLLRDHPHLALELEGFRQYLEHYIRGSMEGGFFMTENGTKPWKVRVWDEETKTESWHLGKHFQHAPMIESSFDDFMPSDAVVSEDPSLNENAIYDSADAEKKHITLARRGYNALKLDARDNKGRFDHDLLEYVELVSTGNDFCMCSDCVKARSPERTMKASVAAALREGIRKAISESREAQVLENRESQRENRAAKTVALNVIAELLKRK